MGEQFYDMLVQVLVCFVTLAALCGAAVVPVEEADIQLTASDSDTGNWTANMGEMQVNIEHEHSSGANSNGSWTLTMARTLFDKEEEQRTEEDTSKEKINESVQSTEATTSSTPEIEPLEDSYYNSINSIPVEMKPLEDSYSLDYPNFIPQQVYPLPDMYRMLPPQPMGIVPQVRRYPYAPFPQDRFMSQTENNLDSDEVVLDPDNFEYFKGVGWFKLDDRAMSWEAAREACAAAGAHLAVPDTQDRVRVFLALFQRHPDIPRNSILRNQVYVGVSDPLKNRVFSTVQGNIFSPDFPIWFANEPDNAPPGEDCVTFHMEGKTRDVPCFYNLPFFCEKDIPLVI